MTNKNPKQAVSINQTQNGDAPDAQDEPLKIDLLGKLSKNFEMQFKDISQKQRQQAG